MNQKHFSGRPLSRPQLTWPAVTLLASLFIVLFDNRLFWSSLFSKLGPGLSADWPLPLLAGVILLLLLNLVFTLVAFRWVLKPFVAIILLLCAGISYFADTFGVIVDPSMIHNILETDVAEASELLTWPLVWHFVLYAGLPISLLLLVKVRYSGWPREVLMRGGVLIGSLVLVAGLGFANYQKISFFAREHRDLRMYINPTFAIHSLKKAIKTNYFTHTEEPLRAIARDATRSDHSPRKVVVLVLGETARAQSFSLDGYPRNTNPRLSQEAVINFPNVASCGTSTAESLPCLFSPMERNNYSRSDALRSENLLDILSQTGVKVVWLDNDSGSKGVAKRVVYKDLAHQKVPQLCSSDNCFDGILLKELESVLTSTTEDTFVILHTKGSHGPSYYKRTPPEFKEFLPECAQDDVQDCSPQEVVNAYDNTIVYTDYILSEVINRLKEQDLDAAMLYLSDHGESLGENGLYLHGLPYALAPEEQTHVPMIFWATEKFFTDEQINRQALVNARQQSYSHDNLFHSILDIFDIKTELYNPELDMFSMSRSSARS
ncbi:MAG: phosphoethanolamine--lipid A transferase [Desulfuromonadales bacterium]